MRTAAVDSFRQSPPASIGPLCILLFAIEHVHLAARTVGVAVTSAAAV